MHKYLSDIPKRTLLKATFWANAASTVIGMPVTLLIASPINLYPTGWKFFVAPPEDAVGLFFMITLWWFFFFPVSYQIEKWVTRKSLRSSSSPNKINKAVFKANLTSYGILFLLTGFATLYFWFKE
jgi:hypothetical protein